MRNHSVIREIDGGGSSHISQNSVIPHFGLGNASQIDKITVYWTGGNKQSMTNVKPNQRITIIEIPAKKKSGSVIIYLAAGLFVVMLLFVLLRRLLQQKNN